jgi:hypothetical protein
VAGVTSKRSSVNVPWESLSIFEIRRIPTVPCWSSIGVASIERSSSFAGN